MKNTTLKYRFHVLICSLILLFSAGCSKENGVVRIWGDGSDSLPSIDNNKDTVIITPSFSAYVDGYKIDTRNSLSESKDPITHQSILHIFIYKNDTDPDQGKHFHKGLYTVLKSGRLVPVYNAVKLPPGTYKMFALSSNGTPYDNVPDFDPVTGNSRYVYNGLDDIWGESDSIVIGKDSLPNIAFQMQRSCCRIGFDFIPNRGSDEIELTEVILSAPTEEECSWSISTGIIAPAETLESILPLRINGLNAAGFILPCRMRTSLELSVSLKINGVTHSYQADVPIPYGKIYQFGFRYDYQVRIDGENILIN